MEVLAFKILDCFDGVKHVAYKGAVRQSGKDEVFVCICKIIVQRVSSFSISQSKILLKDSKN